VGRGGGFSLPKVRGARGLGGEAKEENRQRATLLGVGATKRGRAFRNPKAY